MQQYDDFTYSLLPPSWLFCFLSECPRAEECVHFLSGTVVPDDKKRGFAVFPTALKDGDCPYFKPIKKVMGAWGFNTLFDNVKAKHAPELRASIKKHLGSNWAYYRYNRGEALLSPEQQEWIIKLFGSYGYTDNLQFDGYKEVYSL